MKFKQYLTEGWQGKQGETLYSIDLLNDKRLTKQLSISKHEQHGKEYFEITIITEKDAPHTVRGVSESIVRKKIEDEAKALKSYNRSVATAKKKGWNKIAKQYDGKRYR